MNRFVIINIFFKFIYSGQQKHIVIWRIDIDPNYFQQIKSEQPTKDIFDNDQIFDEIKMYKPVVPLSLRFIHYQTFIKGNNVNELLLYINEDSQKDEIEQISIEKLAKKFHNKEKEN